MWPGILPSKPNSPPWTPEIVLSMIHVSPPFDCAPPTMPPTSTPVSYSYSFNHYFCKYGVNMINLNLFVPSSYYMCMSSLCHLHWQRALLLWIILLLNWLILKKALVCICTLTNTFISSIHYWTLRTESVIYPRYFLKENIQVWVTM